LDKSLVQYEFSCFSIDPYSGVSCKLFILLYISCICVILEATDGIDDYCSCNRQYCM